MFTEFGNGKSSMELKCKIIGHGKIYEHTVDGRNPAPVGIWFIPL